MHEFAVAEALLQRLNEVARTSGGLLDTGGWHVVIHVPASAGLASDALAGATDVLRELGDGPACDLRLQFIDVPGEAACRTCTDLDGHPLRFPFSPHSPSACPTCGTAGPRISTSAWIESIERAPSLRPMA